MPDSPAGAGGTRTLAALVAVSPLLCLPGLHDAANLPQSAWIAASGWLWLAWQGRLVGPPPRWLGAALAWSALTLAWAASPAPGFRIWLHWSTCAALFLAARGLWRTPRDAAPVWWGLTASATAVAHLGLAQHLAGFALVPQAVAPAATFVNKNVAAGFVVLTWPLAAGLLALASTRPQRWFLGLALAAQAAYVWVAYSRSAWLAVLAQIVLGLLLVWRTTWVRRLAAWTALAAALGALGVFGGGLPGPAGGALHHVAAAGRALAGDDASLDASVVSVRGRLAVWSNTLAMAADRPLLGWGLGGQAAQYPLYAHARRIDPLFSAEHQLDFVHNDLLQVAAEQGLVGLGLTLGVLVAGVAGLRRALREARDGGERALVVAAALVVGGACVDACFSFPLERALPPLLLALVAASVASRPPAAAQRASALVRWTALAVAVAVGPSCARWLAADHRVAQALAARARGDVEVARRAAERAATLDPAAFVPLFVLGDLSLTQQRPAEARHWLDRALQLRPHDPATLGARAAASALARDWVAAAADARRVTELLPGDARAWFELGRHLERAGRPAEALPAYRRACDFAPGRAEWQLRRGVAAWRAGAREEALQAAQTALRLEPNAALAHKLLGLILLDEPNRGDEGREHLRTALSLDPAIADAQRLRAALTPPRAER